MEKLAAQAADDLADAPAEEIIRWAVQTFGDRLCITSSMTDAVLIHLASQVHEGLDVIFLDTGYHFAETIGTRDAVQAIYPVNVINVTPSRTVEEQEAALGPRLYGRNPDLCCYLRKVVPLERALDPYDAWITGVRREETAARSDTKAVQWDPRRQMVKVNPIVAWTQEQVDTYIAEQRRAGQPAGLRRLPVDRLRHLHDEGGGRGRPAQRPVDRHGQDRMRYPHLTPPPLVAIAHGSRDPRAGAAITELLGVARERAAPARPGWAGHRGPRSWAMPRRPGPGAGRARQRQPADARGGARRRRVARRARRSARSGERGGPGGRPPG